jgi:predicted nucleic acid-binding protein
MRYVLDTNICIYALKNRPPAVLEARADARLARSSVEIAIFRAGGQTPK